MSSDKGHARLGPLLGLCVLALSIFVAGCQVRPLYGTGPGDPGVAAILPSISVEAPETRIEQVFRNDLLFGLRGGGEGDPPIYELTYQLRIIRDGLALEEEAGTPTTYLLQAAMDIELTDLNTGQVVMENLLRANASYDRSTQEFANVRARRDAENRLAASLAQSAQARLATHFANP